MNNERKTEGTIPLREGGAEQLPILSFLITLLLTGPRM